MGSLSWGLLAVGLAAAVLVMTVQFAVGTTDPRDVSAINGLYSSLGSPPLVGWTSAGGDPCGELWQGVNCVFSNITELRLNNQNLGGVIGETLGDFESIINIDFGNNHIGGTIPSSLPPTVRNLSLSGNQLNGSIPASLSALTQLLQLSLNDNHLSEEIPDSFQNLKSLISLDLSGNNLSGQLPPSLGSLSSINFLYVQNNKLTGVLDVLQDLPLLDLDVENNLFSGPIPAKLLNVPDFRKDGNPFNTSVLPSPPAALPPFVAGAPSPSPGGSSWEPAKGPSSPEITESMGTKKFWTNRRITFVAIAGLAVFLVLLVGIVVWRCLKGHIKKNGKKYRAGEFEATLKKPNLSDESSYQPSYQGQKALKEAAMKPVDEHMVDSGSIATVSKQPDEHVIDLNKMPASFRHKRDNSTDMRVGEVKSMRLQSPISSPLCPSFTEAAVNSEEINSLTNYFTIAALQQYTNSFAEENLIGQGTFGSVYRAELPDGKPLAVKKLDNNASRSQTDEEFLHLVSTIARLKHSNIVELVGYCNEHGQRLLVFQYCKNGSLYDALHVDNGMMHRKLSWNQRIHVALGAARALQYMHEACQPPIVHQNLKSANVLLDDKSIARISECGLAPLLSFASASQLSERLLVSYGSSEFESGSYTCQSDVYSLGVVMLELLTGRKSFDRSRPRVEQYLVGWAIPQLHDIDALSRMVDPSLHGAYPVKSLSRFADIISRCIQLEPGFRPLISEIIQDLLHMV